MTKNDDRMIMVVDRVLLFADQYFQGFSPSDSVDYETAVLDNYQYEKRTIAEKDYNLKQPIAYCMIVNPEIKKIFAYKRSSKPGEYDESRLRGKWSWGIGGHIDKIDLNEENPIRASMLREVTEEIEISNMSEPTILGYINDDETSVGQVHFGLLYLVNTLARVIKPKDPEIAMGEFQTLDHLEKISISPSVSVESWSLIALDPLRQILGPPETEG